MPAGHTAQQPPVRRRPSPATAPHLTAQQQALPVPELVEGELPGLEEEEEEEAEVAGSGGHVGRPWHRGWLHLPVGRHAGPTCRGMSIALTPALSATAHCLQVQYELVEGGDEGEAPVVAAATGAPETEAAAVDPKARELAAARFLVCVDLPVGAACRSALICLLRHAAQRLLAFQAWMANPPPLPQGAAAVEREANQADHHMWVSGPETSWLHKASSLEEERGGQDTCIMCF